MRRPESNEYAEFYGPYVGRVPEGDVLALLEEQIGTTESLARGFGEEGAGHRYAPGKWSVKQVLGHLNDTERVFAYRALAIARGDTTPLPGFDQDDYVARGDFDERSLESLLDELVGLRRSTLALFRTFGPGTEERSGTANGLPFTVRSILYVIAGHELHHVDVLRERYR